MSRSAEIPSAVWVWGVALLALPAHHVARRYLRVPLEPAELAAMPLLVYAALLWVRGRRVRPSIVDLGVAAWLVGILAATILVCVLRGRADRATPLRELAVTGYLAALYLAIRISASDVALRRFPMLFAVSAAIAAALGTLGVGLSIAGIDNPLALPATAPYPYLGTAARARALTTTPAMLASILTLGLLLVVFAWKARRWMRLTVGAVIALGFVLTFSKTILCLLAGFATAAYVRRRRDGLRRPPLLVLVAAVVLLATVYVLTSHFVILRDSADRVVFERGMFVSEAPFTRFSLGSSGYVVLRTSYFINKRTSLLAIARTWPLGVGPGRQPAFAGALRSEGLYPATLYLGAPHSTYLGAAAEAGLAGVLGLIGFLGALTIAVVRLGAHPRVPPGFAAAALGALVALLVEALATDSMHFRHYWWFAAVVASHSTANSQAQGARATGPTLAVG